MNAKILDNVTITQSFEELLTTLSEKERNVIAKRAWLNWERETLQSIWSSFTPSITRERVRQIEDSWIKKISRNIKNSNLAEIHKSWLNFVSLHWWVMASETLINNIIKDLNISWEVNFPMIEMILQASNELEKSKQKLGCRIFFHFPTIKKSQIDLIHKEALKVLKKKKNVMEKNTLYNTIITNLSLSGQVSSVFVDSCLKLFEDIVYWEENLIWLTKWKILNPKTLKDKTIYVMKKEKTPMHFVDIANKITDLLEEKVKINTIHNELIRNSEFVLIGRWIYALKEWWYNPGTVLDVICMILEKASDPMSTDEITAEVLKIRKVRPTTIYMNLQNKNVFERVWRKYYQLKS